MSDYKENIKIASMTYNKCTNQLINTFGITIEEDLPPRQKFHLALAVLQGLIEDSSNSNIENDLCLDDFSKTEIRAVFEAVAIKILKAAKRLNKTRNLTREKFIRKVCKYLHENCGMTEVTRLHVNAKNGIYPILNKNFKWLFLKYKEVIETDGSSPDAKIKFHGARWVKLTE